MPSSPQATARESERIWRMPIAPEDYDRSPLTDEERRALEKYGTIQRFNGRTKEFIAARKALARFDQPVTDVYRLRYKGPLSTVLIEVKCLLRREMHRLRKMFWDWSPSEWMDVLCPSPAVFWEKHGRKAVIRMAIMDMAYLLGGMVNDLLPIGMEHNSTSSANVYFGSELVAQQCTRIIDVLKEKGYRDGRSSVHQIRQNLSLLFILNRSPFLEDIRAELLAAQIEGAEERKRVVLGRVRIALEELDLLPSRQKEKVPTPRIFEKRGMASE